MNKLQKLEICKQLESMINAMKLILFSLDDNEQVMLQKLTKVSTSILEFSISLAEVKPDADN